jgi:hypothetical protein
MQPRQDEFYLFTVLLLGVGGSLLALVGIWLEKRLGRRSNRIFGASLFLAFSLIAAALWISGQPAGAVGPFLALAAACLAAFAAQSALVRWGMSRLLKPSVIWGILLVVSPVFSLVYAYRINRPAPLPPLITDAGPGIRRDPLYPLGVTDLGREITLFQYDASKSPETLGDILVEQEELSQKVIRVAGPDAACNCHGWVFTSGRYGVASEDVDKILADNGYQIVEEPREGDVIIYRDDLDRVRHTGLIRFVGADGLVLVESKWGSLGIYLHAPADQPYGRFFHFYHSSRPDHALSMKPAASPRSGQGGAERERREREHGRASAT